MHSTARESIALRAQAEQIADHFSQPIGRPSELANPDKVQVLLAAIADGNYRETACKVAGIAKQTFYNWLKAADAGDQRAIAFVDALEKAEGAAEAATVRNVRKASELPQFWAAGMTWLERKSPDRWGKRQDDSSVPKVVIQLGVTGDRVQINTFASRPSTVSDDLHRLTGDPESDNQRYVKPHARVPELPAVTDQVTAAEPGGGPTGEGVAPCTPDGAVQLKTPVKRGRGRPRKKRG